MLMFPQWPAHFASEECRAARWAPPPRFAPYLARPLLLPSLQQQRTPQVDEESSGGSSPEHPGSNSEAYCGCDWSGCGAQFAGVARLSAHVARVHARPHCDGLFYCGWRGCTRPQRGFNARYKMLVHVRTHTNERPHACPHCLKSFSRAENLKIHLRSHSGEKPYVCPFEGCSKAYSNSSDRFKHTRTHTVDKPYCCKVAGCNKRYTDPSSLRKHVKTYKHFAPTTTERESSPETIEDSHTTSEKPDSPVQRLSPNLRNTSPVGTNAPIYSPVTYMRPYPMRVPQCEMSYMEYTQMYEHAYRVYYSNRMSQRAPSVCEDVYYKKKFEGSLVELSPYKSVDSEMPLNLKCTDKRLNYDESITSDNGSPYQLLNVDTPLDLSIKS